MRTLIYCREDGDSVPVRVPEVGQFTPGELVDLDDETAAVLLERNPCFREVGRVRLAAAAPEPEFPVDAAPEFLAADPIPDYDNEETGYEDGIRADGEYPDAST